jgi:magnesium-transporting ATPase (P-type)
VAVIRGNKGLSETCMASNLVVGDIITIEAGMRIPADCILIDGMDVNCDESMYKGG